MLQHEKRLLQTKLISIWKRETIMKKDAPMKLNEKRRSVLIDELRGVAIILVIIGHCISNGSGSGYFSNQGYYENIAFKFIYSFHMPLFMIISGYLFKNSVGGGKRPEVFWKKKLNSLIIPAISYGLISGTINILIRIFNRDAFTFSSVLIEYAHRVLDLWFLWAALFSMIITYIINRHFSDKLIVHIIVLCMFFVISDKANLYLYKFMYPFFISGYYYNKYRNSNGQGENTRKHLWTFIVSVVLFAVLLNLYKARDYIYESRYSILSSQYGAGLQLSIDIYRFAVGLIGSVVVISLFQILDNYHILDRFKLLPVCGKLSIGLYFISMLITSYLLPNATKDFSLVPLITVFESIAVILISLVLSILMDKNKFLRAIILGGR